MNLRKQTLLPLVWPCLVVLLFPNLLPAQDNVTSSNTQITIKFKPKLLTVDANEGIDIADFNKDGKLDVIAGRNWFPAPGFLQPEGRFPALLPGRASACGYSPLPLW